MATTVKTFPKTTWSSSIRIPRVGSVVILVVFKTRWRSTYRSSNLIYYETYGHARGKQPWSQKHHKVYLPFLVPHYDKKKVPHYLLLCGLHSLLSKWYSLLILFNKMSFLKFFLLHKKCHFKFSIQYYIHFQFNINCKIQ